MVRCAFSFSYNSASMRFPESWINRSCSCELAFWCSRLSRSSRMGLESNLSNLRALSMSSLVNRVHCLFGGQTFESAAYVHGLLNVLGANSRHKSSTAGLHIDESVGGEQAYRTAHGREADAQLSRDSIHIEPLSRRELFRQDGLAKALVNFIDGSPLLDLR